MAIDLEAMRGTIYEVQQQKWRPQQYQKLNFYQLRMAIRSKNIVSITMLVKSTAFIPKRIMAAIVLFVTLLPSCGVKALTTMMK